MRSELNLVRGDVKLLEQLAGVAVAEDRVGGEVVSGVHEVGFGRRCFACATDSGLGVADNAVVEVNEAGLNEGSQGEDDRGAVAAGVGYEACGFDLVAMQFGAAVDGLGLEEGSVLGVGVFELVDLSVCRMLEPPCAAEIDDLDAPLDGFRNPLTGLLVGSGEEQDLDSGVDDALPGEGDDLVSLAACEGELRVDVFEVERGVGVGFSGASEKCGCCFAEPGMMQEQARKFAARVAGDTGDCRSGRGGA